MNKSYPIEALLRPRVEGASAFLALLMAAFMLFFQGYLMMPPTVALTTTVFFVGYGLWRVGQTWRLTRYQRYITRLPRYVLKRHRIPVSKSRQFIGIGFAWGQQHTQRLRDTLLPRNRHYFEQGLIFGLARRVSSACEDLTGLSWLSRILEADAWFNPFRPLPPVGGRPEIHGVGLLEHEQKIWLPLRERVGHTVVLGTTRVGKTRLAEILINQDIRRGDTTIVFDPKGDADLLRGMYAAAKQAGRLDKFYIFHLAFPEFSARYNPVGSYSRITEVANRIANQLPSEGNSAAFKEFSWRFVNIIAGALEALGETVTYDSIRSAATDIEALLMHYFAHWLERHGPGDWKTRRDRIRYALTARRDDPNKPKGIAPLTNEERKRGIDAVSLARVFSETLQESAQHDPVGDGLLSAFKYDRAYFDKLISSLLPLLEKLTTGRVSELLSPNYDDPDDPRPIFDWRSVIRSNAIVYVGLAALQDVTVASAVGNSMFADLTSVAGEIYAYGINRGAPDDASTDYPPVSLHADEFNELIGPEFVPMLNKAGGAKFQVTVYTQTWSDVEARLGNRARAEQVAGNLNTTIMLRVKSMETAELLTDQVPPVQVQQLMQVSGAADSSDPTSATEFTSSTQERITTLEVPAIQPADLVRLPKGQAFALVDGGQLLKVRLPLPDNRDLDALPNSIAALTDHMKREYRTGATCLYDTWYEAMMGVENNTERGGTALESDRNKHSQKRDSADMSMASNDMMDIDD